MYVHHMHAGAHGNQENMFDLLELELQGAVTG